MTAWPRHPDGRNKKLGEMTPGERREQLQIAVDTLKREFAFAAAGMDADTFRRASAQIKAQIGIAQVLADAHPATQCE